MRTFTRSEGVYVHVDDLAKSLRRMAESGEFIDQANKAMVAVATALEGVKTAALEDAIAQSLDRPTTIFDLFRL